MAKVRSIPWITVDLTDEQSKAIQSQADQLREMAMDGTPGMWVAQIFGSYMKVFVMNTAQGLALQEIMGAQIGKTTNGRNPMPADRRLTIETAYVGQKVKCVEGASFVRLATGAVRPALDEGSQHVIADIQGGFPVTATLRGMGEWMFSLDRFIPADPEPAPSWATEDLRKALIAWKHVWDTSTFPDETADYGLNDAIEASGLLPRAPASTTDRAASIDGEWFV